MKSNKVQKLRDRLTNDYRVASTSVLINEGHALAVYSQNLDTRQRALNMANEAGLSTMTYPDKVIAWDAR